MAIEVNGVTLPDFPEGVFDVYPHGTLVGVSVEGTSMFCILATTHPIAFVPLAIAQAGGADDATSDGIGAIGPGAAQYMYTVGESTDWVSIGESIDSVPKLPIGDGYEVVWANHDIYIATAYDAATNEITVGTEIYFADSTAPTYADEYRVKSSFLVAMAEQARRLTGKSGRMTTEQIQAGLESVTSGGSGENTGMLFECGASGTIPTYQSSEANSNLELSDAFESSATGELTS